MTDNGKTKWECPICRNNAYQRFGGVTVPAERITVDPKTQQEIKQSTSIRMGTHFMCKGCSVFFSNPNLFNFYKIDTSPKNVHIDIEVLSEKAQDVYKEFVRECGIGNAELWAWEVGESYQDDSVPVSYIGADKCRVIDEELRRLKYREGDCVGLIFSW